MLFVFEGVDGVGKSTLVTTVRDKLAELGISAVILSDPSKELEATKAIREEVFANEYHPDQASVLFKAARIILEKHISSYPKDTVILLDRYWPSTAVYQYKGLKEGLVHKVVALILSAIPVAKYFHIYQDATVILDRFRNRNGEVNHYDADSLDKIQFRMQNYLDVFNLQDTITGNKTEHICCDNTAADIVTQIIRKIKGESR